MGTRPRECDHLEQHRRRRARRSAPSPLGCKRHAPHGLPTSPEQKFSNAERQSIWTEHTGPSFALEPCAASRRALSKTHGAHIRAHCGVILPPYWIRTICISDLFCVSGVPAFAPSHLQRRQGEASTSS